MSPQGDAVPKAPPVADPFEALELLDPESVDGATFAQGGPVMVDTVPLFEALVRALDRNPARLVEVDRLVRDLRATESGARLFPALFDEVWVPLWSAYQSLSPSARTRRSA